MRKLLILASLFGGFETVVAQDGQPHKYALLVGIRNYEHPDIDKSKLVYPEDDAKAVRQLLTASGYDVDILLGKEATQAGIRKLLEKLSEKGGNKGVAIVGLFGHGTEFESTKKSYFFPYDTTLKAVRDSQGQIRNNDNGEQMMDPNVDTMISIDDFLAALKESKAANRVLWADCCRNDPNAARSRSFGTSLETNQLPKNSAVFFACSAQEKAHEHKDWAHGAFTKCLLQSLQESSKRGKSLMGSIAEDVEPAVEKLVAEKTRDSQTPRFLSTGARVDLQLATPGPTPGVELGTNQFGHFKI